jgi:hypothetical protein
MGLAISYKLRLSATTVDLIRAKIVALHAIAKEYSFAWIGEIVELEGDACKLDMEDRHDPLDFMKIHAAKLLNVTSNGNFNYQYPNHLIAFEASPGEGCQTTTFGLALHRDFDTNNDWSLTSFCKTQYASNPEYGGLENFLQCHLKVVAMLDAAQNLGIQCEVSDCGGYWETRDRSVLISALNDSNFFVAAVMGSVKDGVDKSTSMTVEAPIMEYPNFEYLEAEGQKLADRE